MSLKLHFQYIYIYIYIYILSSNEYILILLNTILILNHPYYIVDMSTPIIYTTIPFNHIQSN